MVDEDSAATVESLEAGTQRRGQPLAHNRLPVVDG